MTMPPPLCVDEPMRLAALRKLRLVETPLEERFERITRLAKLIFRVEIVAISLLEADRQWFKSIQGLNVDSTSRDVSFCGHAILNDEVMVVPDARRDPRFRDNPLVTEEPHIASYAGCPIRSADGMKIGTLCLIDSRPREYNERDIRALRDLAELAEAECRAASAQAVHAQLVEDLVEEQRRAMIDSLTRVWNREGVARVLADGIRSGEGVGVVLVDLDDFKPVNDGFGHAAGDEALRIFARRLIGGVRETDTVGRFGGDEFVLALHPCPDEKVVECVIERVRARLSEPFEVAGRQLEFRASFGVHIVQPGKACGVAEALACADAAMYDAKRSGRDRVSFGQRSDVA